jgi:hypothetical protein
MALEQPTVEKEATENIGKIRKEWRQPELRKMPIAWTAMKGHGNEGQGGGKGDNINVS